MKIPAVTNIRTSTRKLNQISKQLNSTDVKSIKTYSQYLKEYGLKK